MPGLVDEGFEEVHASESKPDKQLPANQSSANRPDLRVVQVEVDRDGRTNYRNVGGMWRNVSRNGNEFYTLLIGNMKLLVFPNTSKGSEKAAQSASQAAMEDVK